MPSDPAVLAYLAGLLDGEGNVGIASAFDKKKSKNRSYYPHLMIANTYEPVMRWLEDLVGGTVDVHVPSTNKAHYKTCYRWRLHGKNAETFLRAVRPYLRIKHEQADVVFELQKVRGKNATLHGTLTEAQVAEREALKMRINDLNRKGC